MRMTPALFRSVLSLLLVVVHAADVQVGKIVYRDPLTQYGSEIGPVLSSHAPTVDWYINLGMAFASKIPQHVDYLPHTINAYAQAERLYLENALAPKEKLPLAFLYFDMSVAYVWANQPAQAFEYIVKAERVFSSMIYEADLESDEQLSAEQSWAMSCYEIASMLSDPNQEGVNVEDLEVAMPAALREEYESLLESDDASTQSEGLALKLRYERLLKAQVYLDRAIEIYRRILTQRLRPQAQISVQDNFASTLLLAGSVASAVSNTVKSTARKEEATKLYKAMAWLEGIDEKQIYTRLAYLLHGLSADYVHVGRYQDARLVYREAMKIFDMHHIPTPQLPARNVEQVRLEFPDLETCEAREDCAAILGSMYLKSGDLKQAESHLSRAVVELRGKDDPDFATILFHLAQVYFMNHKFEESVKLCDEAMELFEKKGQRPDITLVKAKEYRLTA